jgi:sec-independent protein translocase protein TatB
MFDIGGFELLLILTIAIIALKPEDLPSAMVKFGRVIGRLRYISSEFYRIIEEAGDIEEQKEKSKNQKLDYDYQSTIEKPEIIDEDENDEDEETK